MNISGISTVKRALSAGLLFAAVLSLGSACSKDAKLDGGSTEYSNGIIRVGTSVGNSQELTRAFADTDHEALKTGTKLRLRVSGRWDGHTPNPQILYPLGTANAEVGASRKNTVSFDAANQFYWDDFGTGDPVNTAGRAEGLSIMACGVDDGTTAAPNPADWTALPWSVIKTGSNVMTKDLVISNTITTTDNYYKYDRDASSPIQIDMQHAMSMVTVKIKAGEGFPTTGIGATTYKFETTPDFTLSSNGFSVTGETEYAMTSGSVNITTVTVTGDPLSVDKVKTETVSTSDAQWTVIKRALIFPGSRLARTTGTDLVGCITVDGNEYDVIAANMRTVMTANPGHNSEYTKPGYNYIFQITVQKTGITVEASVEKWVDVTADEQEGIIQFAADVASSSITSPASGTYSALTSDGSVINVFSFPGTESTFTKPTDPSTVATYSTSGSKFSYVPKLYWQNKDDNHKFRALAKTAAGSTDATPKTAAYNSLSLAQGTSADDVLWGTSAQHTATLVGGGSENYAEGASIKPRTSTVPLMFYHRQAKITIDLKTTGTAEDEHTEWVDLDGASINISNLSTTGTFALGNGTVTPTTPVTADAINGDVDAVAVDKMSATTEIADFLVIPQTIGNTSIVTVTLADGTQYKIQLNTCKVSSTPLTTWEPGKHYKYTFTLKKTQIEMLASIVKWTVVNVDNEDIVIE